MLKKKKRKKLEHFLPYTKIKRIKNLNIRSESIKLLDENIGGTLYDINHSKILYVPPPRVMEIKINKWELIKLKSFCTATEITQGEKKNHRMGENNSK